MDVYMQWPLKLFLIYIYLFTYLSILLLLFLLKHGSTKI